MTVHRRDYTPLVMSILLLLGILILALVRYRRMPGIWMGFPVNLDVVLVVLYVLWLLAETRIAKQDMNTEGKVTPDAATCQIYGFGQALTFLSGLGFPPVWNGPNPAHFIGIGLFLLGIGYRSWAVHTLGAFYSHRVRTLVRHRIVDSGPYRFTRHPAYAGMIVSHAGVVIFFLHPVTLCVFGLVLVPAIILRIVREEKMLFQIEGYADFAQKRKRLFPGIW